MTAHDIKKQIALSLCKARTDIKLIRQYDRHYMIGMNDFIRMVNESLPDLIETYNQCDDTAVVSRREFQALTLDAYDVLAKEFL